MKNKYVFVLVMLLSILIISMGLTTIYVDQNQDMTKDEDFVVVTSFYPMYIAAMNVMEDVPGVTLKNLSEPQTGCLHDFQLTPEDMKLLSTADVFIINGGGIESFMEEIAAAYPNLVVVEACEGISLLGDEDSHLHEEEHIHETETEHIHEEEHIHESETDHVHGEESSDAHDHDHGENAHAWMSVSLYRKQVDNMVHGLSEANPENASYYEKNGLSYDKKLAALEEEQEEIVALVQGQSAIMFHCAFDYVAEEYGVNVAFCMDLDEERQVSAGEVAEVLSVIENENVRLIFAEELYGKSMCDLVQKETDVTVVYLDPLNRGEHEADSYIKNMTQNMELLREALENSGGF